MTSQAVSLLENAATAGRRSLAYDADGCLASDRETRGDGSTSSRTLAFDPTGCMRSITREDLSAAATTTSAASEYTCGLDGRVVACATVKPDGSRSRRIDFAGLAEIRPDEGIFMLRVSLSGTVSVEDARSLATGDRVEALSGYLISDARGSVLATTGFSSAAPDFTREAEYDAWGKKRVGYSALSAPRHGFAGAEPDEAVGTYSFGAHTYDPSLRRWVSPDPLLAAIPSFDDHLGDNLNLYAYSGNNPVKRLDLSGFWGEEWKAALQGSRLVNAVVGLAYGVGQGVMPGGVLLTPNQSRDAPHAAVFQHWQGAGQIIGGTISAGAGVTGGGVAVAAEGATVGGASPVAVPVAIISAAAVANGVIAISAGMKNVAQARALGDTPADPKTARQAEGTGTKSDTGVRQKSGGGRNDQHANQDKRAAASERYEKLKAERDKQRIETNKTPASKALEAKTEKALKKAKQQMDFSGENHSQRGKR